MFYKPVITNCTKRSLHVSRRLNFRIPFLPALPQAPGGVRGDVNEAYVPPKADKMHGSYHWDFERIVAVSIIPLVTIPTLGLSSMPLHSTIDAVLCVTAMSHFFLEFQSCITDYVQKRVYGKIQNYAMYLLYGGSLLSLIGIYNLQSEENQGFTGLLTKVFGKDTKNESIESKK
ncbi:hypothetical protein Kpol_1024p21 [Vanderwaltozyma polyspora DSM 70294]|uniref:Succinate dehydrogenase [ubiquinone] cytochrome b small subunit n=1 Tax=Vanderwaltozyma polyspora (strain ATCC 22028 / DSM 70294 / BCRC 21397 / CBS 2163 / NBRC 10782 / NRRL Y-8283 / UCD 57-17) TaxID=436907 RepID=A7TLI2_VANPO|nr:uncharacterized protein Kpol_1024p21 [Vanderwaltozyma polyspora DSM 70294]EDO16868.1 hypothetical protein Kpol_1024p21 [Vanderwaltozyma polyspora DSM 70294]